ncbi:hypothetical protein F5146DRAFT_1006429 [Armillaria mellea]|nr:hypothetical protein F5146DRAFT_1006429 [Armillaria mellea]
MNKQDSGREYRVHGYPSRYGVLRRKDSMRLLLGTVALGRIPRDVQKRLCAVSLSFYQLRFGEPTLAPGDAARATRQLEARVSPCLPRRSPEGELKRDYLKLQDVEVDLDESNLKYSRQMHPRNAVTSLTSSAAISFSVECDKNCLNDSSLSNICNAEDARLQFHNFNMYNVNDLSLISTIPLQPSKNRKNNLEIDWQRA